ncbi:diacylglycerol/lipid kinase family protein [Polaribacter tangerinus]|uniref:diacylglycerol/lipid kinase family protein n=1 Tax=Polaribacter tangerinus TaxID=1920034 RepID=UPI000B4BA92F|nr:diacylglycerol kinase family protein [Polaribacter tangerinus]
MSNFINISDDNSWFIIANPTAGNGKFSKQWKKIKQLLKHKNVDFSYAFTQYSKHEILLVNEAIKQGFRKIISIGGDGTLHNVVNGVMLQRYVKTSDITISVIPLGTGNDWIKTYNIPKSIHKSIEIITRNNTTLQDIGVITTQNNTVTYFNNLAGLGYDGYVVYKLKNLKKLGAFSYLIAGIYGLLFYKKSIFTIVINNKTIKTRCLMTVFGICKYAGGGMQFTKNVVVSDGLLDISIFKNIGFFDLILNLPKLYTGTIIHHKKVTTYKTKEITVIPEKNSPYIQADGELIGNGKLQVTILQKAIRFVIT